MKILVTGISGFIGSHVARVLLAAGHEVSGIVLPGDTLWRLPDAINDLRLVFTDLASSATLKPFLADWKPEACVHLAWYAEPGEYLSSPKNLPSLSNSLLLLEELLWSGCKKIIMAGTCAEYDQEIGFMKETSITRPGTLYAATKLSLNLIGRSLAEAAGAAFIWGRVFYLYGPFEDKRRVVPSLIQSLLSSKEFSATEGAQVRDYLHVEDVAHAFRLLVERSSSGIFNISSCVPITIRQLMQTIGDIIGRTELIKFGALPYRNQDPMFICGDNTLLRQIGWRPRFSLREGLEHVVNWWRAAASKAGPDFHASQT